MTAPLLPGERLLWEGRPERGVPPDLSNPGSLVFGAAFAGFALFWMLLAYEAGDYFWTFGLIHFPLALSSCWLARLAVPSSAVTLGTR